MNDPAAGGFFRYATRRDWTAPHYEKLLGDNAEMLALYASAYEATADPSLARTARGILAFLFGTLQDPGTGAFFSSQDADEEYYLLDADGRAALELLEAEPVDAVLSDLRMPGLDGFELCRIAKAGEADGRSGWRDSHGPPTCIPSRRWRLPRHWRKRRIRRQRTK